MNAKKCDRCGTFYENYNESCSKDDPNSLVPASTDAELKYFIYDTIELCPECMKSFKEWLAKVSQ